MGTLQWFANVQCERHHLLSFSTAQLFFLQLSDTRWFVMALGYSGMVFHLQMIVLTHWFRLTFDMARYLGG